MAAPMYLAASYDPWVVLVSALIACFASYVAIDLTKRVRSEDARVNRAWWLAGSLVMGSGIWSMHFVGMLAYILPMELGYRSLPTVVSWAAAVGASMVALKVASAPVLGLRRLLVGAASMTLGICTMHYLGMAAIDLAPGIVWDLRWVALSVLIAFAASAAALGIFFYLRRGVDGRGWAAQGLASLAMGAAICAMHYTGMAGAQVPVGAVCLSADALGGNGLGALIALATLGTLGTTLLTSLIDSRLRSRAVRLAVSLKDANADLQAANEELKRRAYTDPLTGLPNRALFEQRLAHAAEGCRQVADRLGWDASRTLAVLFIDLDGFKPVNDVYGHATGDMVLKEVALRLRGAARAGDMLARVGGDEFVLLIEGLASEQQGHEVARHLIDAVSRPYRLSQGQASLSCSVGIAMLGPHDDAARLVAQADAAMYQAKRRGGRRGEVFDPRLDKGALDQMNLVADLREAIARHQLSLHYQPKVDGRTGSMRGVEALLRWQHPQRGMVGPAVFVPLAERYGLMHALGDWVIEQACAQIAAWRDEGLVMSVSINVSLHQLRREGLVQRIQDAMQRHGVDPAQLVCEITESVAMDDVGSTERAFESLAGMGVYLSIDDFGTGHASLSHLRQLPAKQLKIDRSFVRDLEASADARAIVDAVIRLAHALGLSVVAEGVETAGQRDILHGLDCDEMQGFLFARPMPAQALRDWGMRDAPPADTPPPEDSPALRREDPALA
jgi:diguanylate cyclase (GGDEF)-like protein